MSHVIQIQTNATALARVFGDMAAQQFPYASAQALTSLAFMAQRKEKEEVAQVFHLRNRYSQTGIQVNKAEKSDWPNQQSEVGIDKGRSYLIDHILGGQRAGGTHGRAILAQEGLRNSRGRVPKVNRPAALLRKGKGKSGRQTGSANGQHSTPLPFIIKTTSKWNNEVLVRRVGDERYPLQILYAFKPNVKIKREFEMDVVAAQTVAGQFYPTFNKALARAIASAKNKAERSASKSAGNIIDGGR